MGCLTRIGCMGVLAVGAAAAWIAYGDRLPPELIGAVRRAKALVITSPQTTTARANPTRGSEMASDQKAIANRPGAWVALSDGMSDAESSSGARNRLAGLAQRTGPAYATFTTAELADLLAVPLIRSLPGSASRIEIALVDDQLKLRAEVQRQDFVGDGAIGALLGSAIAGRDTLELVGTLEALRPGLVIYRVRSLQLKHIALPSAMIPTVMNIVRERARNTVQKQTASSLPPDALALVLSPAVADVRIHNGTLTLYRAVP